MKKSSLLFILIGVFSIILTSCEKINLSEDDEIIDKSTLKIRTALIDAGYTGIYSPNLSAYSRHNTKSVTQPFFNSFELLWDKPIKISHNGFDFTIIEVSNTKQISNFSLPTDLPLSGFERKTRAYLIGKSKSGIDQVDFFVLTVIGISSFQHEKDGFNFFDLSRFNGVLITSDVEGNNASAILYVSGKIYNLEPKSSSNPKGAFAEFNLHIGSLNATKCDCDKYDWDLGQLNEITLVAYRKDPLYIFPPLWTAYWSDIEEQKDFYFFGGGAEGGGGATPPPPFKYNVILGASEGGNVSGSGEYDLAAYVTVKATPLPGYKFVMWTGDISSSTPEYSFRITSHIKADAVFHKLLPCVSPNESNPLLEMEILPTKNNGVKGGRFGYGRGRFHKGVDLSAPVGTPLYAMFDGDVVSAISRYDQSTPWENYNKTYGDDFDGSGNVVNIISKIDGKDVVFSYWHLAEVCVKRNDKVKAGDIIGTVGTTGNASDPDCAGPHLHLTTYDKKAQNKSKKEEGDYFNPEIFLYTKFDNQGKAYRLCIEKK